MTSSSSHSAAGSALGYEYQIRWAFLELLSNGPHDGALTLEMHDDVAWEDNGSATELIQVKHHINAKGSLGDASVDLWRTINSWIDNGSPTDPYGPILTLITTSTAADGSAAAYLRDDPNGRDPKKALAQLEQAAQSSDSTTTQPWRERFLLISPADRTLFVNRMHVVDSEQPIGDLDVVVRERLWAALPHGIGAQEVFLSLLWRWWAEVSVDLLRGRRSGITRSQIQEQIQTVRDQFGADSLPTVIELEDIDEDVVVDLHGNSVFVHQLNWVGVGRDNLRTAVVDYHRAVTQETEWLDKDLIGIEELQRFEARLVDEWRRVFGDMVEDLPPTADEDTKKRAGLELFRRLREFDRGDSARAIHGWLLRPWKAA